MDSRSTFTTDYANLDDSHTLISSPQAINYQSPDGSWSAVDNTVVTDPTLSGAFTNAANSWHVHFGTAAQGIAVQTATGTMSFTPLGATNVAPTVNPDHSGVTYADVWPGADLQFRVTGSGVEESIVIKSRQAGSQFAFSVDVGSSSAVMNQMAGGAAGTATGASTLKANADGSLSSSQSAVSSIRISRPVVLNHSGEGLAQAKAAMAVSNKHLAIDLDPTWLANQPDSAFPVVLDPAINPLPTTTESFKSDGFSCNPCDPQFGNPDEAGTTVYWRSVDYFPYESLFGDYVTDAQIYATTWEQGTQSAYSASVYWANAYSYTGAIGTASGHAAHGSVLATTTPMTKSFSGSALTNQVESWVANRTSGSAFGFKGTETANLYTYQQFVMKIQITYDRPPSTPTGAGFNHAYPTTPNGCTTGTGRPKIDASVPFALQAKVSDIDGDKVQAQVQYWDLASSATKHILGSSGFVTSNTNATLGVAGGTTTFADTHSYGFQVRAYDNHLYSGWSAACEFTVADPAPNTPTALAFAAPSVACPVSVTINTGTSAPGVQVSAVIKDPDNPEGKTDQALFSFSWSGGSWTAPATAYKTGGTYVSSPVPPGTIPDKTTFTWTVKAYNGQKYSPVASCSATSSNTAPPPPQVTATGFGTPASPSGYIGDSGSITLSSPGATIFVWEAGTNGAAQSMPAPGACGSTAASVTTTCVTDGSGRAVLPMRAWVPQATISAVAYATNGGVASSIGSGTFEVNEYQPNHAWLTDQVTDPTTTTLPDSVSSTGPAFAIPPTDVTWVPSADANLNNGDALEFDATTDATTGSSGSTLTIDTGHSFTIGVWLRPTAASSTSGVNVALSEDGTTNSGFLLGQYANYWAFCMPHTQTYATGYDGDCTYVAQNANYLNQWTFLVATWDSIGQQMQLQAMSPGQATASGAVAHTTTGAAAGAMVMGAFQDYFEYPSWVGDVMNPVTYQGIADASQINSVYQCGVQPYDLSASCTSGSS